MTITLIQAESKWSRDLAIMTGELLNEIMGVIGQQAFRFELAEANQQLHQYLTDQTYHVFIAVDAAMEGQAAGFVSAYESHAIYAGGLFGTIAELYVRPEYRQRGIGKELVAALAAYGLQRGWKRLEVTTPPLPEFHGALSFYEAQEFSVTGGRKLQRGF